MLGAILGDLLGSQFEGGRCQDPKAQLLSDGCQFTDDTVLTIAVAQALIEDGDIATSLRTWTRRYPNRGYGGSFLEWAAAEKNKLSNLRRGPQPLLTDTRRDYAELKPSRQPSFSHAPVKIQPTSGNTSLLPSVTTFVAQYRSVRKYLGSRHSPKTPFPML
jgi:hypothetical protein